MVWPQGAAVALLSMDLGATLVTQVTIYRVIVAFPINAFAQMAMHPMEQAWEIGTSEHHGLFDWLRTQSFKLLSMAPICLRGCSHDGTV
jgi:hypothetical protein